MSAGDPVTPAGPGLADLVAALRAVSSDLDGHIERRAAALAEPLISAAKGLLAGELREAECVTRRLQDALAEMRQCRTELDRQLGWAHEAIGVLLGAADRERPGVQEIAALYAAAVAGRQRTAQARPGC
jgi:hypothetical protein